MKSSCVRLSLPSILLIILAILPCRALTQQSPTEDPNNYPGSWYRIALDANGRYTSGDGHGYGNGTWYSYTATGWYRQWFYHQPFDPAGKGHLRYAVYVQAIDNTKPTTLEVNVNWTTPTWSQGKAKQPPLPKDAPTAGDEARYMMSRGLYRVDNQSIKASAQSFTFTVDQYAPEWVSIDIRGKNAHVYGGVLRESASSLDFGDAPATYKTLLADDGARHIVVQGIYLGRAVDVEADGRPGASASGDDLDGTSDEDGVVFTSPLSPGESAMVEVTAATPGYLNAWIDFDGDGGFAGNGTSKASAPNSEQIFTDQLLAPGVNRLSFQVPATAVKGITFARFRFNTRGQLSYQGPAADGEVEDHQVTVAERLEPQVNSGKGELKWSQTPQPFDAATPFILNAWGEPSALHLRRIAADDWRCDEEGPITGFQWSGSFGGWTQSALPQELPPAFHLAIWTDGGTGSDPKATGHPGTLVWETFCTHWVWNVAGYYSDPRRAGNDTCFQFTCLLSQDEWFYPQLTTADGKTTPAVYWLSIAAFYDPNASAPAHPWAWTTRPQFFGAGAVQIAGVESADPRELSWPPAPGSRWQTGATVEFPKGTAWDLAFEVLTPQAGGGRDGSLAPVYRFRSNATGSHFYTISEAEKDTLIRGSAKAWTFEGIAFYAYPPDRAPVGSKPVYRFRSKSTGSHVYSISESEKQKFVTQQSQTWTFEGIAWYAFD